MIIVLSFIFVYPVSL